MDNIFYEKIQILKEVATELKTDIPNGDIETACARIQIMNGWINELLMSGTEVLVQVKLIGISKTLEDILNALIRGDFDSAELYVIVHLEALLNEFEQKEEEQKLLEIIKNAKEELNKQKELIDFMQMEQINKKRQLEKIIEEEVFTPENFIFKYEKSEDEEVQEIVDFVKRNQCLGISNYDFIRNYNREKIEVFFDEEVGMDYIMFMDKRMYFPLKSSKKWVIDYTNGILAEQDEKSPHCYVKEGFLVQEGDVVIDAGVAEGNFALSIIDKVKKIYLVEPDEKWLPALKKTFEPYRDKVVFVDKFLSDMVDQENITIDELAKDEEINYIKMDIEGAERKALLGAENTIKNSSRLTIAACAYHNRGDEEWIKSYMEKYDLKTDTAHGYMINTFDIRACLSLELRKGLVFARK